MPGPRAHSISSAPFIDEQPLSRPAVPARVLMFRMGSIYMLLSPHTAASHSCPCVIPPPHTSPGCFAAIAAFEAIFSIVTVLMVSVANLATCSSHLSDAIPHITKRHLPHACSLVSCWNFPERELTDRQTLKADLQEFTGGELSHMGDCRSSAQLPVSTHPQSSGLIY